jgi:glutaminyl-peptide cyclotransferase
MYKLNFHLRLQISFIFGVFEQNIYDMKKPFYSIVLIFCLLITFLSCSNKPEQSRKPVSTITIQPSKTNYVFGEKVLAKVTTKVNNGDIKNILFYYENQLIKESNELEFSAEVTLNSLGNSNFKAIAIKTDGVENSRVQAVSVVSDIVPKKYTYQVVNTFPHLKTSYTQGLEFHNGFLYEGTGEYGESMLLKVNPSTGNAIQTYRLDDIYFGEGITILNNKIYQLTYREQTGFIYNLTDFTLIDSFRYSSKEGWGLTNDGTNLIMSNGTNVLTWLDPNNFSIVKTVQVANNMGAVHNLNELEFIDGKILANIYTTELIVEIDTETGKVLSEINLSGILNMYKNPSETVDYMNGIAYDKTNDRLFITGKWWPRLFEIKLKESE